MSENLYEGMFLISSTQFAADPDKMTAEVVGLLEKAGATVVAQRPWQDGRLAYEIEGERKALHYLTYFRADPAAIKPLIRSCKLSPIVIRQMFIKQPQSLFDAMVAALTGQGQETETADEPAPEKPVAEETSESGEGEGKMETISAAVTDDE